MKNPKQYLVMVTFFLVTAMLISAYTVLSKSTSPEKKPTHTPRFESTEKEHGNSDKKQDNDQEESDLTSTPDTNRVSDKDRDKKENYLGTIKAVESATLIVQVDEGEDKVFSITEDTRVKIPSLKDALPVNLPVGGHVFVQCLKLSDDSLLALSINLIPGKPQPVHRVGVVTEYLPEKSISIEDTRDGTVYKFIITEQTKLLPDDRTFQISVGSSVTIISPRDTTGGPLTADGIVVHPDIHTTETQTVTPTPTPTLTLTPLP